VPEDLQDWVGNREESEDVIAIWPVRALHATLDLEGPSLVHGDPLPPLWHWLFFLPTVPHSGLGVDGHPEKGGFLPPVPLPRRMFAGARYEFRRPLRIGEAARSVGEVVAVTEKEGAGGPLVFVLVRYEVSGENGLGIVAEHDIVYREAPGGAPDYGRGTGPIPTAAWSRTITPDPVMLFRYSALTFNAHRIHYDHPYVTLAEGYPGLVVHGPLTAMLLADLARCNGPGPLQTFSFRARSPLFAGSPITLLGDLDGNQADLAAWSHDGRLAVTATAEFGTGNQ
jgi:3-methylfumaryl-CoA hydratase